VEAKKAELRALLGGQTPELLGAADLIGDMAAGCRAVAANLAHVQGVFAGLARSLAAPGGSRDLAAGLSPEQAELYGEQG